MRVKPAEAAAQILQGRPHQRPDLAQRMAGRNAALGIDVGKQPTLVSELTAHCPHSTAKLRHGITNSEKPTGFSANC
jgi:hypothetical protein